MLPAPIWPLAVHASFGQNCSDASIGSVVLFIIHSMPLDACFFQALLTFSPVSGGLPIPLMRVFIPVNTDRVDWEQFELPPRVLPPPGGPLDNSSTA